MYVGQEVVSGVVTLMQQKVNFSVIESTCYRVCLNHGLIRFILYINTITKIPRMPCFAQKTGTTYDHTHIYLTCFISFLLI